MGLQIQVQYYWLEFFLKKKSPHGILSISQKFLTNPMKRGLTDVRNF